jgi:hypothetical protein
MDLLKAELARKKAEKAAKLSAQGAAASADPKARFVRRGDLAKAAETARLEEIERERKETELKKRKREEENAQVHLAFWLYSKAFCTQKPAHSIAIDALHEGLNNYS